MLCLWQKSNFQNPQGFKLVCTHEEKCVEMMVP